MTSDAGANDSLTAQLELARQVQLSLLPKRACRLAGWEIAFSYDAAGYVSGDYVDLVEENEDAFYLLLGDVSGKGIAASMLMSHLHATIRTLLSTRIGLAEILAHTSRTFCQSSLAAQFATMVMAKVHATGKIEIVNAGHPPVLWRQTEGVRLIGASDLPLGMFCSTMFHVSEFSIQPGGVLLFCSDGITESLNQDDVEYGTERLAALLLDTKAHSAAELLAEINRDLLEYTGGAPAIDDRSLLIARFDPVVAS